MTEAKNSLELKKKYAKVRCFAQFFEKIFVSTYVRDLNQNLQNSQNLTLAKINALKLIINLINFKKQ